MPRKRRGSGFSRSKLGRYKDGYGCKGRGTRGRPPVSRVLLEEVEPDSANRTSFMNTEEFETAQPEIVQDSVQPGPIIKTEPLPVFVTDSVDRLPVTEQPQEKTLHCIGVMKEEKNEEDATDEIRQDIIDEVVNLLRDRLYKNWIPVADQEGFHILLLSRGHDKAIQRNIFCYFSGGVRITVHRRSLPAELYSEILQNSAPSVTLSAASVREFVDRIMSLVSVVRAFEVCVGEKKREHEQFWSSDDSGTVDLNVFDETRYLKTFRTHDCWMLVPVQKWKCINCLKAGERFRRKKRKDSSDFNQNT